MKDVASDKSYLISVIYMGESWAHPIRGQVHQAYAFSQEWLPRHRKKAICRDGKTQFYHQQDRNRTEQAIRRRGWCRRLANPGRGCGDGRSKLTASPRLSQPVSLPAGWSPIAKLNTLHMWINDALIALFFFVVGLEIKRKVLDGELAQLPTGASWPQLWGMPCAAGSDPPRTCSSPSQAFRPVRNRWTRPSWACCWAH